MLNHWLIYTFNAVSSGRGTKFILPSAYKVLSIAGKV